MTPKNPRIPNFFIVGAPRCGTTSLTRWLGQHPEVFFAESKVPFHFGSDLDMIPKRQYRDLDTYLALFTAARDHKYLGESTPFYLYSREAAREIKELSPDARLIIMLRNPVDMMYSMHARNLKDGNDDVRQFRRALELEKERVAGKQIPENAHFPQGLFYRRMAHFSEQIQRFLEFFPRAQIHTILFEDLKSDPLKTMRNVTRFLGIDEDIAFSFEVANKSQTLRSTTLVGYLKNPPLYFRLIPQALREAMAWRLNQFNLRTIPPEAMDGDLRIQLLEEFRTEIDELGQILGLDLSHWSRTSEA